MLINYICPKCNGSLFVNDYIIFSTKVSQQKSGLILLHPELGNYTVFSNPSFTISEGEQVDFFCPICHVKLASEVNQNLAKIIMVDEHGVQFRIYFSQIKGEQSTYQVVGEHVNVFGKHSEKYMDFLNLSNMR